MISNAQPDGKTTSPIWIAVQEAVLTVGRYRLGTADEVPGTVSNQQMSSKHGSRGARRGKVLGSNQQLHHLPKGESSSSSTSDLAESQNGKLIGCRNQLQRQHRKRLGAAQHAVALRDPGLPLRLLFSRVSMQQHA